MTVWENNRGKFGNFFDEGVTWNLKLRWKGSESGTSQGGIRSRPILRIGASQIRRVDEVSDTARCEEHIPSG